jgi:hypothetical protein
MPLPPLAIRSGILVLSGYGLRVAVHRKHLVASDGVCDDRRELRVAKATAGLRRLVMIGHTGTITLEALRLAARHRCLGRTARCRWAGDFGLGTGQSR